MDISNWFLFASIAFVATISPGPAILLVTTHSFSYGLKRSVATMFGNILGLFIMSAFSVAGLSALILHSTTLFFIVKMIGAAYLIYLGIKLFINGFGSEIPVTGDKLNGKKTPSLRKLFIHGLFVALSNPKVIVFTTALFPQFVDHSQAILPQFAILVVTFMTLSFVCLLGYGYLSAGASNRVKDHRLSNLFSKLFGVVFIITGGLLAGAPQKQG